MRNHEKGEKGEKGDKTTNNSYVGKNIITKSNNIFNMASCS